MIPHDKALHFIAGTLVYAAVHFVSPMAGLGAVFLVGVGKEVYDKYNGGQVEAKDAVYTILGGVAGFVCGL